MKVLVTFAVESEFAPWLRLHNFRRLSGVAFPTYEAGIGPTTVRVRLTGIGAEPARRATAEGLSFAPDLCISSGLAGALKPEYSVGDILAARAVIWGGSQSALAANAACLALAADCRARVVDRFATSEKLVMGVAEKRQIGQAADVVEMESYAVLSEAAKLAVPAIAIRAISDTWDRELPYAFDVACDGHGRVRLPALLAQVARRPGGVPALIRLARDCGHAARLLAKFLDLYIGSVAAQEADAEFDMVWAT